MSQNNILLTIKHKSGIINVLGENADVELGIVSTDENIVSNVDDTINITSEILTTLNSYDINVIDSVKAGKKVHSSQYNFYASVLKPIFDTLEINHKHLVTTSANSIQEFAQSLLDKSPTKNQLYLFLSGDTSIFEFINFLYPSFSKSSISSLINITILPFPHGTGNALCNSIKLFDNILSIKALFRCHISHLPLYKLESNNKLQSLNENPLKFPDNSTIFFLVVASWCLHSLLVYESDTPEMRQKYGSDRFKIAAMKILEQNPIFNANITFENSDIKSLSYNDENKHWSVDNTFKEQSLSYFLLAGVSNFEKTFKISPDSKPEKDQLHLLVFPHMPSDDILKLMYDAYDSGKHVNDPRVFYKALNLSSSLQLKLSDDIDPELDILCLDGSSWKVTGPDKSLAFSVHRQSVFYYLS